MAVRIGELLLKEKRITPEQLQEALNYQKANGGKLGYNLVKLGYVKDEEIIALLSKQYGVPSINLAQFQIDPAVIKLVPAETAQKYQIVPLSRSGATLTIAMTDPTNVFAMDDIKFMTGYNVEPVVASEIAVTEAIETYYAELAKTTMTAASGGSALDLATKALEEMPSADEGDVQVLEDLEEINAETLAKRKDVLVRFMQAYRETIEWMYSDPAALKAYAEYGIDLRKGAYTGLYKASDHHSSSQAAA